MEPFVLCRSAARREKEKAMLARREQRLWQKLLEIHQSLEKKSASADVMERRAGKWLGRCPAAEKLFEVEVRLNEQRQAGGLSVACVVDRRQWAAQAQGAYLLRTHCAEKDAAKVWDWHLQLQQAESAFRCAKSDLSPRPIFHHKTERVEAHLLVCFLSLARWRVLEQWMSGKGLGTCARQLVGEIAPIKSPDVILPVKTAEGVSERRLRTVARPERLVAELLQRLGLTLPQQSRIVENAVAKVVQKSGSKMRKPRQISIALSRTAEDGLAANRKLASHWPTAGIRRQVGGGEATPCSMTAPRRISRRPP